MPPFDPQHYGACRELLTAAPAIPLGPGEAIQTATDALEQLQWADIGPQQDMARCCLAGLWFRYGFLEQSHVISQDLHTPEGSYWHGIMHRHEPDYPNAKYWFRQVGSHPLFASLGEAAAQVAKKYPPAASATDELTRGQPWNPYNFVDLCEANERGGAGHGLCVGLVELEWEMLFDYCYTAASKDR